MKPLTKLSWLASALWALSTPAWAGWQVIDGFEAANLGTLNNQNGWVGTAATVIVDPDNAGNQLGWFAATANQSSNLRLASPITNGTTATLFLKLRVDTDNNDTATPVLNWSAGMADTITGTVNGEFADYEAQLNQNRDAGNPGYNQVRVRSGGSFIQMADLHPTQWYKVWMVIDNAADTVQVYLQGGQFPTPTQMVVGGVSAFGFRNGAAANNLTHFFVRNTTVNSGPFLDDLYIDYAGQNLTEPSSVPVPPKVQNLNPADATMYYAAGGGLSFNVTSTQPIANGSVKMTLNGVDVPLQISGDPQNLTATYGNLKPNQFYQGLITVTNATGGNATRFSFDTFIATEVLEWEAEYYNFSGGQHIENPELSFTAGPDNYLDQLATEGIDTHQISTTTGAAPFRIGDIAGTEVTGDLKRQKFLETGMDDYNVGWNVAGEWLNYTHTFPVRTWQVYARMALSTLAPMRAQLDWVTSGSTTATQATVPAGQFSAPGTGVGQTYTYVPLTDALGNKVLIRTTGKQTLRFTPLTDSFNFNYLTLVPEATTGQLQPIVTSAYPPANATGVLPDMLVAATLADRDTRVQASTVKLLVDGVEVSGVSVTTAPATTFVNYHAAAFLQTNTTYRLALVFQDSAGATITNEWQFTTVATAVPVLTAAIARPADAGLVRGFAVRTVQGPATPTLPNTVDRVEAQLAGLLTNASVYVVTESSGSDIPAVINYAQDTANIGNFNPNNLIPGLGTHTDNLAMEVVTYLQLSRGAYRFGVAKDDGCRVTAGPVPANTNLVLGISPANGEFTFDFLVETNGLYPFRLVYYEGNGGAGVEWHAVNLMTNQRTLINKSNSTIQAYRTIQGMPNQVTIAKQPPAALTWPANNRATLTVEAAAPGLSYPYALMYQWQKNGVDMAGETKPTYVTPILTTSDNATYKCIVTQPGYQSTSTANLQLTVVEDVTPPTVVRVVGSGSLDTVTVSFSEPIEPNSAQTPSNYSLSGGLTISGATVDASGTNVVLNTSAQTQGATYTLTINGMVDRANLGLAPNTTKTFQTFTAMSGILLREVFNGITGTTVANLTAAPAFMNHQPDVVGTLTLFEAPATYGDNYGQRVSGFVSAPEDGSYTFYIASDDSSELWLSPDDSPLNKAMVASVNGYTGGREWTKYADTQTSLPITLQKGNRYYIEALQKDGTGGDNLAVAWTLPSQAGQANSTNVIGAAYISGLVNPETATLQITQQPANATVLQNRPATFQVVASGTSEVGTNVLYQWQRDNANIANATNATYTLPSPQPADSGARFQCLVALSGKMLTSDAATLTVTADVAAPGVAAVGGLSGSGSVVVLFDENVEAASANNVANYTVNGAAVTSAVLSSRQNLVLLKVASLSGDTVNVTVTGIKDLVGNTVAAAIGQRTRQHPVLHRCRHPGHQQPGDLQRSARNRHGPAPQRHGLRHGGGRLRHLEQCGRLPLPLPAGYRRLRREGPRRQPAGRQHLEQGRPDGSRKPGRHQPHDGLDRHTPGQRGGTKPDGGPAARRGRRGLFGHRGDHLVPRPMGVPYPNAWLRIQRVGESFFLFLGTNGTTWTPFMTNTPATPYPASVYVGVATTSHDNAANRTTLAEYRDFAFAGAVPPAKPPTMTFSVQGATLILGWPAEAIGFKLQSSPVLPATAWQDVAGSEATNSVSVTIGAGNQYYRLKQ